MMTKLTEVLMWWEKVPDTPAARKFLKGWVYEVAEDADAIPAAQIMTGRSTFSKSVFRDFTRVVLAAEGSDDRPEDARRVWVTINELKAEDWGIGGHIDWLRDYISALDEVGDYKAPT
jgi:hypothetical protein